MFITTKEDSLMDISSIVAFLLMVVLTPLAGLAKIRELKVYPRLTYILEGLYRITVAILIRIFF
jgi:hypothetical protein